MANNPFIHVELSTDDVGKSKDFYSKLFTWKFEEVSSGAGLVYTVIRAGEGILGGMLPRQLPNAPTSWLPYVQVESVEETIRKAKDLRARVLVDKMPIPNVGHFGIFFDPMGVPMGVREPLKR